MQEAFFDYLENIGLAHKNNEELVRALSRKSRAKLGKLIDDLEEFIVEPSARISSPFEFLANGAFSGGPSPCASYKCRAGRLQEMAYFAALYADKIWFPSPFRNLESAEDLNSLRTELAFYIDHLQRLRPLFDAGLMELTPNASANLCRDCYARMIGQSSSGFGKSYSQLERELDRRYLQELEYYVEIYNGRVAVVARGPLLEHESSMYFPSNPPQRILKIANEAKAPVPLPRDLVDKYKIPRCFSGDVMDDILDQNYYSKRYGTSYLTQRPIDRELINALAPKTIRDTNALLATSFTHELPVVAGIDLQDLVRVRRAEGDSFSIYRDALNKAIKDVKNDDPRKMKQAFSDVVIPEIHRVNCAIDTARKTLIKDVLLNTAVATGVVGVGLFSGILPPNIGQIVGALGGYHFFQTAGTKLAGIVLEPPKLKDNSFYFLWNVMRHSKSR